uniref:Uncharacterized protein n=1 Tax=Ananas comosus var. bracteatus TaxID=296719 RepID=A0A6V7Q1T1_ANACO|nr:unnamed protein product [Ananas comosus var. bracteatus]
MGLSPSKRVEEALRASPEFAAACDGAFARCRAEAAGAFPGVLPHQLPRAAQLLHADLSASLPLVRRWASPASPPSRARVDAALRRAVSGAAAAAAVEARGLDRDEFGDFAAELFGAAVLAGAAGAAARGAAAGAAAIAGAGVAARAGAGVVARAVGAYAAAVVVAVYVGLS